jgi:hypothetical protein
VVGLGETVMHSISPGSWIDVDGGSGDVRILRYQLEFSPYVSPFAN